MAMYMPCPHCGKSIIPVEKWVGVWQKGVLRKNVIAWGVLGMIGLFMIAFGGIIFVLYHLSRIGLAGVTAIILGCIIVGRAVLHYFRAARTKQLQQACPFCKHHWVGQVHGRNATEALESYFTDVEELRAEFEKLVVAPTLSRHQLIVHGVGGVGKSSLLRMFRLHCRKMNIPVAFSSGDEAKSLVDVLSDWAKDLTAQGLPLLKFTQIFNEYRAVQQKVEEKAKAEQKSQGETSKFAIKMAVQTAGGIASFIPLIGPALSIVVGGASDTLVDWLHGFLNKQEIDLLLDPTDELTEGFLSDLVDAINREDRTRPARRVVLLLDTLEQLAALSRWICELVQQVHPDVLLVFAGRSVPNWEQQWPGWTTQARVEELRPMTGEVMRELVHRYYATQRGGEPDPKQVDAIIQFARGLPIAVTAIVQLWVQYGLEDFQAVRAQVVADLVDRLTKGTPERVRPVLKAAATLRWFNADLLTIVTGEHALGDDIYEELRRFPFVRPRKEGLALHDSVREHLDHNLRVHEPQRHHEMHQRAATYFEAQLQIVKGEESADLVLEALYHKMMADEDEGIKQYRKAAEELVRYQLLNQLRTLLNDVNNYTLQKENSRLWREYYRARLRDLEGRRPDAIPLYHQVADNKQAEDILRAYALCDIVWVTGRTDIEYKARMLESIREMFPKPEDLPEPDAKLGFYLLEVGELYQEQGRSGGLTYLERALRLFERIGDLYWIAFTHNQIKYYYLNRGMWKEGEKRQKLGLQEIKKLVGEQQQSYLEAELLAGVSVGWIRAGRYRETEENLRKALSITEQFERALQRIYFLRDLAFVVGLQGKVQESTKYFNEGIEQARQQDPLFETVAQGFQGIVALKWTGAEQAEPLLVSCMSELSRHSGNKWDILNFLVEYGMLHEMKGDMEAAEKAYRECLELRQFERWYSHVGALIGLVRVYYHKGEYSALASVLHEAEELAQQYEYNNYLASLRLTQGHLAWDSKDSDAGQRFETALHCYQQTLIFALRYNRFLLDEVLSGSPQRTPLQAIIPHCLERSEEGQSMLLKLRDWWQIGMNDPGFPRSDSISAIPEGISLLAGERLARQQEPGDDTIQQTILEQLDTAL